LRTFSNASLYGFIAIFKLAFQAELYYRLFALGAAQSLDKLAFQAVNALTDWEQILQTGI